MKLNLTYVDRKSRTSSAGKPFTSITIKAREYGEKFLSGFGSKENQGWNVGDEVEVAEVKEVQKGDKTYLNFEMPRVERSNGEGLGKIYFSLGNLERLVKDVVEQNKQIIEKLSSKVGPSPYHPTDPADAAAFWAAKNIEVSSGDDLDAGEIPF